MSCVPVAVCAVGEHEEAKDPGPFSSHICEIHINLVLLDMDDHTVIILNLVERCLGSNQPLHDKTRRIAPVVMLWARSSSVEAHSSRVREDRRVANFLRGLTSSFFPTRK
eukprot:12467875-Ditylum_brightwellii.AAC.1